jgi:DNA topoisomerase III
MKTVIAEKPSVAREIARIVGANKKGIGYLSGNGYSVTWAFGHLVTPALPDGYGIKGFRRDNLPIIPTVFTLVPRQVKTEKGYSPDKDVIAQIIVATDAGREGELIFRYLYEYIGCSTPFERLWINSLTDKAIRCGLENLKNGNHYDRLYYAAKARSEADWLVGINATQAITIAAGRGTYSLGRVQTPTLAMICSRYRENKQFVPEAFWQLHVSTAGDTNEEVLILTSVEKWKNKQIAEGTFEIVKKCDSITISKVERKELLQEPPLLYDLTALQKEANTKHGFSAEKTLDIAQKLYEAKLITYPRTGCRYIPEDVFAEIPSLLLTLKGSSKWGGFIDNLNELTHRSVDNTKITDHHALLITGVKPQNLSSDEAIIYHLITGRMLEAFSGECIKDVTTVYAGCSGIGFLLKGFIVKQAGWRTINGEEKENVALPVWLEGDVLPLRAVSLTDGHTKPKPLHTEASLLAAMETAGKETEDEKLRESLSACGIGTPATRASVIETLFQREYMVRQKKSLVPTEKGLALYSLVKGMDIANVEMTGEWERALADIESGKLQAETFRKDIEIHTTQITSELLSYDKFFAHKETQCLCPKCKGGSMQFYSKVVRCDNPSCGFPIFRQIAGKTLADKDILDLLTKGKTEEIKGFQSKQGKTFNAGITFDENLDTQFVFSGSKPNNRKKRE